MGEQVETTHTLMSATNKKHHTMTCTVLISLDFPAFHEYIIRFGGCADSTRSEHSVDM